MKTEKVGEGVEMPALDKLVKRTHRSIRDFHPPIEFHLVADVDEYIKLREAQLNHALTEKEALKREVERLDEELSACREVGGCGYWREAAKQREAELKHYEDSPYRHRVLFENGGELSTKNYDDLSDDDLARLMEYSETCKCQPCYEVGYMLKLRKELSSLRTSVVSGEWVDCKDRMPPQREEILAFDALGHIVIDWLKGNEWAGDSPYEITHWMALPARPKPIEREG